MSPFYRQATSQVPYSSLRGVVRRLRLRYVYDGSRHRSDQDHTTLGFSLHQVAGHSYRKEVSAINIDSPKLLEAVIGVFDSVKILGEAGGSDEVVNLAVMPDDLGDRLVDGVGA